MEKEIVRLSPDEWQSLTKELTSHYRIGMSLFFMAYILLHLIYYAVTNLWIIPWYEPLVFLGLLMLIAGATLLFSRSLRKEIASGIKVINYKIIEEKYSYLDQKDLLSPEYTKYILIAGHEKYIVPEKLYYEARLNDYLVVHSTSIRENKLKLEIQRQKPH